MALETSALTSHAIVGEPFTELIYHNEEDAERVATYHCALMNKRNGSIMFTKRGESIGKITNISQ